MVDNLFFQKIKQFQKALSICGHKGLGVAT